MRDWRGMMCGNEGLARVSAVGWCGMMCGNEGLAREAESAYLAISASTNYELSPIS